MELEPGSGCNPTAKRSRRGPRPSSICRVAIGRCSRLLQAVETLCCSERGGLRGGEWVYVTVLGRWRRRSLS